MNNSAYKALDPSALREHILLSTISDDFHLSEASSKRLIHHYEQRYSPHVTLKGFKGDYYWVQGKIVFYLRTPALPEFGLLASEFAPYGLIVYLSWFGGIRSAPKVFRCAAPINPKTLDAEDRSKLTHMLRLQVGLNDPPPSLNARCVFGSMLRQSISNG